MFKINDKVVHKDGRIGQIIGSRDFKYTVIFVRLPYQKTSMHGVNEEDLKLYVESEDNKMTKNFKEVIADIKEGEVWESKNKIITFDGDGINVNNKDNHFTDRMIFIINDKSYDYTLQRPKVSFTEAFKAYEEGKEIESCVNSDKFEVREYHSKLFFTVEQIKGEWYINN